MYPSLAAHFPWDDGAEAWLRHEGEITDRIGNFILYEYNPDHNPAPSVWGGVKSLVANFLKDQ